MPRLGSGGYSGGGGGGGGGVTNNITNNITNVAGLGLEDYGTWTAGANLISTVNNDLLATSIDFPTDDSDYLVTIKDTNTGALGSYIVTQEDFAGITDTVAEVAWNALSATTPDEDNSIRMSHSHNRAAFLGKGVAGKLMIGYTATGVDLTVTLQRIMPADPPAAVAKDVKGAKIASMTIHGKTLAQFQDISGWVLETDAPTGYTTELITGSGNPPADAADGNLVFPLEPADSQFGHVVEVTNAGVVVLSLVRAFASDLGKSYTYDATEGYNIIIFASESELNTNRGAFTVRSGQVSIVPATPEIFVNIYVANI